MDPLTLIGILSGFGLLTYSMMLGKGGIILFVDVPSVIMVVGGTTAVFLMNFTVQDVKSLMPVFIRAFLDKLPKPGELIDKIVALASLSRKEGLLSLESKLKEIDDPFFAKGLQLVIDGFPADTVRQILELESNWSNARHGVGKKMLDQLAAYAPAFGMIGTLVGLVQMLASLDDPSSIGGGMAVALLTTLYGAVIANMICLPLSGKLELRAKEEAMIRELMIEGIVAIQSGDGPQLIKEKLKTFVPPAGREASKAA
jgi:chemotaxis protein MotA